MIMLPTGIQASRAPELLKRRLDDVLELLIEAALLNLIPVELRDLVAGNVVVCEFVFREDSQSFQKADRNLARSFGWLVGRRRETLFRAAPYHCRGRHPVSPFGI